MPAPAVLDAAQVTADLIEAWGFYITDRKTVIVAKQAEFKTEDEAAEKAAKGVGENHKTNDKAPALARVAAYN